MTLLSTIKRTAVSATLLFFAAQSAFAQAPQPPEVAARAYLLLDVTANQVLAEKDIDSPVEPASLTKLMSAYIVFDALRSQKNHADPNPAREPTGLEDARLAHVH